MAINDFIIFKIPAKTCQFKILWENIIDTSLNLTDEGTIVPPVMFWMLVRLVAAAKLLKKAHLMNWPGYFFSFPALSPHCLVLLVLCLLLALALFEVDFLETIMP